MKKNKLCSGIAANIPVCACTNFVDKNLYDEVFIDKETKLVYDKDKNLIGQGEYKNGMLVINRNIKK